jgi:hypothetical protein
MNLKLQLRELAARSERVVELANNWVGPSGMNAKGQRPEDNWKRSAGMGLLVGGAPGALLTQRNAAASRDAGVIYRKRDAAADSGRVVTGGLAGGLVGAAAGLGAQRFIPKLHGKLGTFVPLAGTIAGNLAGLAGGYAWANKAGDRRIAEARIDRAKTKMATAYMVDQMKKRQAAAAANS